MGFASLFAFINRIISRKVPPANGSIYDFKIKAVDGREILFQDYRGKKLLIVNTASRCGYTPQLEDLQKLHEQHGNKITVLGFPANDFLRQEPGSNTEVAEFCKRNYGVEFTLFEKISVKGKTMHPLFRWLSGKTGNIPTWNFCKYMVDENGRDVQFFPSKVNPLDPRIVNQIL